MEKYILQKSKERPYWWVVTDTEAGVVVQFEEGRFNETQRATLLEDGCPPALEVAHTLNGIADWIARNHYHLVFNNLSEACDKAAADVGRQIAEGRKAAGMSIRELARRCGQSYPNLSLVENGKRQTTVSTLAKIGKILGVRFTI